MSRTRLYLLGALVVLTSTNAQANFKIDINGLISGQPLTPAMILPGETVPLATYGEPIIAAFGTGIEILQSAPDSWFIKAPSTPGFYPIHFSDAEGVTKSVQLLVAKPYTGQRSESGYRIGTYPNPRTAPKPELYPYPDGLVEVHEHTQHEALSTHFSISQFLCKQTSDWPRYVIVQRPLVVMLENIVTLLQSKGVPLSTLAVLSGYRTPAYNAALDNVEFSRHVYGDAADIYVDSDNDGFMDDLNGDGLVSLQDAQLLARLIATLPDAQQSGIGVYAATAHHGPFVHVDTRGYSARWGKWR